MESHGLGLASALLESLRAQRDFKGLPPLLAATAQSHLDYGQLVFLASLFLAGSPIPILVALNFYRRNSKRWETLISFILTLYLLLAALSLAKSGHLAVLDFNFHVFKQLWMFTLSLWMSIQSLPFIKLLTKRSTPLYVWGAPWILPVKATAVFLLSVGLSGRALLKLDHLLRVAFKESVIDSKDHVVVQMRAAISTCVLSGALAFTSGTIFAVVFAIQLRLHRDQEKRCSSTIWGRPSLPSPTPPNNQPSLSVPPENVSPEPSPISSNSSLTLNDPQSNELPHERSNDSEERGKSKILRMIQLNEFNGTLLAVSAMIAFCAFQLATAVVPWNLKLVWFFEVLCILIATLSLSLILTVKAGIIGRGLRSKQPTQGRRVRTMGAPERSSNLV